MGPGAALIGAALLWIRCSGLPQTPKEHLISTRMVESPERCNSDADCGDPVLLACDPDTRRCRCRDDDAVLALSGGCLPVKQLGEECLEDVQCQVTDRNATCEEKFCACDSGFYLLMGDNGTLCKADQTGSGTGEAARAHVDQNMIIVIAVLAIMFVGICVALHLFSKARFRNRRTIFNSPHPRLMHIKLGKRKKSSVRTAHLPPPGHPVSRHHSFSGHHSPFPINRVPKTRSHECLRSAMNQGFSPHFEPRPRTAPLAERESLPSSEDLDKKSPGASLQNGLPRLLSEEEACPPGSPTVIITDADGAHTVVTRPTTPGASSAANV